MKTSILGRAMSPWSWRSRASAVKDRKLARVYAAGTIPHYWIIDIRRRCAEVYVGLADGQYASPRIRKEGGFLDLVISGQVLGQIPVIDLLPRGPGSQ